MELQEKKLRAEIKITGLKEQLTSTKFCLDRFKYKEGHFNVYTGFEMYEMLNIFYTFLQSGASATICWGSVGNNGLTSKAPKKFSRSRLLKPKLFLKLTRLRCGLPIEGLAVRFSFPTSTVSRIIITWIDFLHA